MNTPPYEEKIYKSAVTLLSYNSRRQMYRQILSHAQKICSVRHGLIYARHNKKLQLVYSTDTGLSKIKFFRNKKNNPYITKKLIVIPIRDKLKLYGQIILLSPKAKVVTKTAKAKLKFITNLFILNTRKLNALQDVKVALKMRDHFISLAAHELKTPLTTIIAYTELIRRKLGRFGNNSFLIDKLSSQTDRLTQLINYLLNIDTLKNGHISFDKKTYIFDELISSTLKKFTDKYPQRKIIFAKKSSLIKHIHCDADKITLALANLLANAEKFSAPKTAIAVDLKSTDKYHYLNIKDRGLGLTKSAVSQIFRPYYIL